MIGQWVQRRWCPINMKVRVSKLSSFGKWNMHYWLFLAFLYFLWEILCFQVGDGEYMTSRFSIMLVFHAFRVFYSLRFATVLTYLVLISNPYFPTCGKKVMFNNYGLAISVFRGKLCRSFTWFRSLIDEPIIFYVGPYENLHSRFCGTRIRI